jgi:uncharacterized protein (TIGR03084 family)
MTELLARLLVDLRAETEALEEVLRGPREEAWSTGTPAEGWTVSDQVSHLAYFDDATTEAITDPEAFGRRRDALLAHGDDFPDQVARDHRGLPVDHLRSWWSTSRSRLMDVLGTRQASARIPWFGPDMSVSSAATARLMETWAHGRDVCEAVGVAQPVTDRLSHVAHLGVRTRAFSYSLRGLDPPGDEVRVELLAPSGATWTWGPQDATSRVSGPAEDFCLVVTQRLHRGDTALVTTGSAEHWLSVAQAFAGAPGPGRPARRPTT